MNNNNEYFRIMHEISLHGLCPAVSVPAPWWKDPGQLVLVAMRHRHHVAVHVRESVVSPWHHRGSELVGHIHVCLQRDLHHPQTRIKLITL